YVERLADSRVTIPFAQSPFCKELVQTGVHLMAVLLPAGTDRLAIMEYMKLHGIQTSIHYPLVHEFAAYRDQAICLPRTESLGQRQLSLPFYPTMRFEDVDLVAKTLRD